MNADSVWALILFLILCFEIFFLYKDILKIKNFKAQNPNKKDVAKYLGLGLLRIIIFALVVFLISLKLDCILFLYYWVGRNSALIDAVRPELNSYKFNFFKYIFCFIFPVSIVCMIFVMIKKKGLVLSLVFPVLVFFGLIFLLCFLDFDIKYYKNPLADTKVSETFKPLNVPLLKEGMTEKEVLELLGDPVFQSENMFVYAKRDGFGWYYYFCLDVYFENDIVVKIDKKWLVED